MIVLIGLALLLVLWCLPWRGQPFIPHEVAFWQSVGAAAALIILASQIPNPGLALAVAWIGLTPMWTVFTAVRGWVRPVERLDHQVSQQVLVIIGVVVYVALVSWWTPERYWWWLILLAGWAVVNLLFACAEVTGWKLATWTTLPGLNVVGLTQTPPFLACLLVVGTLTLPALWGWWWVPVLPLVVFVYRRIPSGQYAAAWALGVTVAVATAWWVTPWAWIAVAIVGCSPLHRRVRTQPQIAARVGAMINQFRRIRQTRFLGCGLACLPVVKPNLEHPPYLLWESSHNDWLHLWLECGPVPVVGMAFGVAWALQGVTDPLSLTAGLQVLFFAIYALVYFPGRVPYQILLWMTALSYLDSPVR